MKPDPKRVKCMRLLAMMMAVCLLFAGNFSRVFAKGKKEKITQKITVEMNHKNVTKQSYCMKLGEKRKLTVRVMLIKGKKRIQYKTSDRAVVTVRKNGMIIAKKPGTAKVTVIVKKGKSRQQTWVKIKVSKATTQAPATTAEAEVTTQAPVTTAEAEVTTQAPATTEVSQPVTNTKKSLVVYFSCTDHTRKIAEQIKESADADIYRIEAADPYTAEDLDYSNVNSRTSKEQNDVTARPVIAGNLPLLMEYDQIYIGYPIWWGEAPKILYTFVESCDLSGKTVIPFCTSASSGIGNSAQNLQNVDHSHASWLPGRRFSGQAAKEEIQTWVAGLNLP